MPDVMDIKSFFGKEGVCIIEHCKGADVEPSINLLCWSSNDNTYEEA